MAQSRVVHTKLNSSLHDDLTHLKYMVYGISTHDIIFINVDMYGNSSEHFECITSAKLTFSCIMTRFIRP